MTYLEILDDGADFFAPVSTDAIASMVAQYQAMRGRVEQIAEVVTGEMAAAMAYFLDGNADRNSRWAAPSVERLFQPAGAVAALNAVYWSKALALTDVLDVMPQARRDEWNKSILERTTPDFAEETVRNTLADLINMRARFFAERVDGIFRGLSGEHVTNAPEGFGKRMIVGYMLSEWGGVNHSRAGLINDLRAVIAKFMGRDEPKHYATAPMIERLKSRWGEWVDVDGGSMRIRLYKKGTAHIEVHPDMAWRLNQILASIYPLAIPPEFRAKPKKRVREFTLIRKPLPFLVIETLACLQRAREKIGDGFRCAQFRDIPNTREFTFNANKDAIPDAERVLEAIGGVKQPGGHFLFDYEPGSVLAEIVVSGCIPDHRSHQFYPTPAGLAQRLVELADIDDCHKVLEPSAGQGGLADLLPKERTTCVEVSELHCKVLEAKGHNAVWGDFLEWSEHPSTTDRFDRVVMNPPFSEGRWQAHLEHAADMLAPGGRLVSILPEGARNRAGLLPGFSKEWHGPFDNEFAGTSVSVVILVANR